MKGRFHPFEGYSKWKCAMPVRVMKLLGIKILIVTNAAGGLNKTFNEGDVMIIKDHINFPGLAGDNPLTGKNDERWGPRFPPMNTAYDRELVKLAKKTAYSLNMDQFIREGVYMMVGGPTYETIAETRLLRILGGDSVGLYF
jgi:purine-nucleoside phosphorylase